ncbi:NYN domain-containing protein [Aquimarina brevivitae]|uniref:OST-HTH/LOTUS domain-containing protein n=1 Tax=Aquimarina brevivitae TaxID=323412 RepID=A0A4Q7NZ01_9FLAO|nr:NYN domain-containing protein [Aquimarina brevivitae]RZS92565.1 OST-HTH/LOTUS domain-containing protein [Aquimarina brevivitae]
MEINLAVLIDGDNIPSAYVKEMMEEIAKYGNPTIKRIYGDWTKPALGKWKNVLLENAISPMQQYGYTKGKNATDSAMIIDAMDILYSGKVQGFCIVSSDSDFTRLATRLREAGMKVYGIGERKTPEPFIVACDKFIYLEILQYHQIDTDANANENSTDQKSSVEKMTAKEIKIISATIDDLADEDGWAFLGDVGNLMQKKQPNFDSRNYGFQKLTPLIRSIDTFEIEQFEAPNGRSKLIYVRNKKKTNSSKRAPRRKK